MASTSAGMSDQRGLWTSISPNAWCPWRSMNRSQRARNSRPSSAARNADEANQSPPYPQGSPVTRLLAGPGRQPPEFEARFGRGQPLRPPNIRLAIAAVCIPRVALDEVEEKADQYHGDRDTGRRVRAKPFQKFSVAPRWSSSPVSDCAAKSAPASLSTPPRKSASTRALRWSTA